MNQEHRKKMKMPTTALFAVTTACCFTNVEATEVQNEAMTPLTWLTYFLCMFSLLLLGILFEQRRLRSMCRRGWEVVEHVIQDIPVDAILPTIWSCGLLAMIFGEWNEMKSPPFVWILYALTIPMIWIGIQLYKYQKAMRYHLLEAILRSQKQTIRSVLRDQGTNIQDELDTVKRRLEGLRFYVSDGFGDLQAQQATIYEQSVRDRAEQNITLNRYFNSQMHYVWGHVDDINQKLFAIHRRLRNLSHLHDVPSESMDSIDLHEIMQLRLDRIQLEGSLTESGTTRSEFDHDNDSEG